MLKKATSVVLVISIVLSFCVIQSSAASNNQSIDTYMKSHFRNFQADIDVTRYIKGGMTMEDVKDAYLDLVYNDSELFYVNIGCRILSISGSYYIQGISYVGDKAGLEARQKQMRDAAAKAYAQLNNSMSDAEKILALNEYLVLYVAYNDQNPNNENGYGALIEKGATCQGYTRGLQYLLSYGKFENRVVREINEKMNHSWNIVKIGSDWYHIDTTKDDPVTNRMDFYGRVSHRFVLTSDEQMAKTDKRSWDRSFYPNATNTQYDNMAWRPAIGSTADKQVRSPLVKHGDYWYYIEIDPKSPANNKSIKNSHKDFGKTNNDIIQYDFRTNTKTKIFSFEGTWFVWGTENSKNKKWWPGSYASIQSHNGLFYYNNNNSIFSFNPETKKATKIADKPKNAKGYIYGIFIENNKLTYTIKEKLAFKDSLVTIDLPEVNSTAIKLNKSSVSGKVGKTATVKASLNPSKSKDYVYWASGDTRIATVEKGKITFKAKGETTITAYTSNGKQASLKVRVT